ncbi:hypothetical protein SCALM49S_04886 [Streptomyces californicus]
MRCTSPRWRSPGCYNLRLKATALSWLPYVSGFGLLPAAVTLTLPGQPWPRWWTVAAGALLGLAAHLADTLPDIAADRAAGVTGLPHRLGAAGTRLLLPLPLLAGRGGAGDRGTDDEHRLVAGVRAAHLCWAATRCAGCPVTDGVRGRRVGTPAPGCPLGPGLAGSRFAVDRGSS